MPIAWFTWPGVTSKNVVTWMGPACGASPALAAKLAPTTARAAHASTLRSDFMRPPIGSDPVRSARGRGGGVRAGFGAGFVTGLSAVRSGHADTADRVLAEQD